MTKYVRFSENNDWEGEEWHVYIPLEGNEDQLRRLRDAIPEDYQEVYSLSTNTFSESQVEALMAGGGSTTYLAEHTQAGGLLVLPDDLSQQWWDNHPLYKHGIFAFGSLHEVDACGTGTYEGDGDGEEW